MTRNEKSNEIETNKLSCDSGKVQSSVEIPPPSKEEKNLELQNIGNLEVAVKSQENSVLMDTQDRTLLTSRMRKGYLYSVLNVLFDSYGVVLTKQHGKKFTSWQINLVRFGFAGAFLLLMSVCMRVSQRHRKHSHEKTWYLLPDLNKSRWIRMIFGIAFVTFACPALSNYALFEIPLGLALTLFSLTPLFAIPLVWLMKNEQPTRKGILGALVAVIGVIVMIMMRN